MSEIYKIAAQKKLRFTTIRGDLTVEQLFHLPLKSPDGCDLDTLAREIFRGLKGATEESFVTSAKPDPREVQLEVMLAIVKDVIATKQEEALAAHERGERAKKRMKLLDAINAKDDAAMTAASKEDLLKQLAALDAA